VAAPAELEQIIRDELRQPLAVPGHRGRGRSYRIEARIYSCLHERRRALIEAAEVEHVERDGRVFELRRLPSV
jgi:hypothetical protein